MVEGIYATNDVLPDHDVARWKRASISYHPSSVFHDGERSLHATPISFGYSIVFSPQTILSGCAEGTFLPTHCFVLQLERGVESVKLLNMYTTLVATLTHRTPQAMFSIDITRD